MNMEGERYRGDLLSVLGREGEGRVLLDDDGRKEGVGDTEAR